MNEKPNKALGRTLLDVQEPWLNNVLGKYPYTKGPLLLYTNVRSLKIIE
jgi:hypothetical protein